MKKLLFAMLMMAAMTACETKPKEYLPPADPTPEATNVGDSTNADTTAVDTADGNTATETATGDTTVANPTVDE